MGTLTGRDPRSCVTVLPHRDVELSEIRPLSQHARSMGFQDSAPWRRWLRTGKGTAREAPPKVKGQMDER